MRRYVAPVQVPVDFLHRHLETTRMPMLHAVCLLIVQYVTAVCSSLGQSMPVACAVRRNR
jgi:hypothetical protein